MISQVAGRLITRDVERVEIATSGGVTYEVSIPLGTFEALPPKGDAVTLFTHLVVRDDEWLFYGFSSGRERAVFRRLLAATGVGPALALGMLSRFDADRLVRAIREKDVETLQSVPRVGRKKAQQLVLDLADKLDDLAGDSGPGTAPSVGGVADPAVRALVSLGVAQPDADKAVREAIAAQGASSDLASLIRDALNRARK
jgi:holliday junction DNA helicase RuvA